MGEKVEEDGDGEQDEEGLPVLSHVCLGQVDGQVGGGHGKCTGRVPDEPVGAGKVSSAKRAFVLVESEQGFAVMLTI